MTNAEYFQLISLSMVLLSLSGWLRGNRLHYQYAAAAWIIPLASGGFLWFVIGNDSSNTDKAGMDFSIFAINSAVFALGFLLREVLLALFLQKRTNRNL